MMTLTLSRVLVVTSGSHARRRRGTLRNIEYIPKAPPSCEYGGSAFYRFPTRLLTSQKPCKELEEATIKGQQG